MSFAVGCGRVEMNSLHPLCVNGDRGADVNLCGVAVRFVDIWEQMALFCVFDKGLSPGVTPGLNAAMLLSR